MKQELPEFFAIKRQHSHPLWNKYMLWLNSKFPNDPIQGIVENYYYGIFKSSIGKPHLNFYYSLPEYCKEITLEEWDSIINSKPKERKLAFKGFVVTSGGLICRNDLFIVNKIYSKATTTTLGPILCTNDGWHYCNELHNVGSHYSFIHPNNVFGIIEVLGDYTEDNDKGTTTSFKIIRLLTDDEVYKYKMQSGKELLIAELNPELKEQFEFNQKIEQAVKDELEKRSKIELEKQKEKTAKIAKSMRLDLVRKFQEQYPHTQICGSVGLFLHGIELKRFKLPINDFDIITPYYTKFENAPGVNISEMSSEGRSGNDFKECILIGGIKADVRIDNTQKYDIIEFDGFKYKVSVLEAIWTAKLRYNKPKHNADLKEAMNLIKK